VGTSAVGLRALVAAGALVLVASLAGCAGAAAAPAAPVHSGQLAIVVGAHANAPTGPLTGKGAWARDVAAAQGSDFQLVVGDGAPYVAADEALTVDAADEAARQAQREANRETIDAAVEEATARTPESDLLAALTLAAQHPVSAPGLRVVLVRDSGLSTTGVLDFRQPGLLDADPEEVADSLADVGQLPALSGVQVVFQGVGETLPSQPDLDPVRKVQLEAIWDAVLRRAGAVDVVFESPTDQRPPSGELPPVSPVELSAPLRCEDGVLTVSGGGMAYRPATSELLDPQAAEDLLRPVAERITSEGLIAEVFGHYAAVGEENRRRELTEERAQAVANVLIDLGVPVSQLRVQGFGSDFPGYVPDRDPAGRLVPATAALNRTVVLEFSRNGSDVGCG
jgi:flagellar motor protein MotB